MFLFKLTVEALKLLNLSIKKHMSPNLTLLLDRTSDSSLSQLGPLLLAKLQDNHWKICEAALQVLITISEFSRNGEVIRTLLLKGLNNFFFRISLLSNYTTAREVSTFSCKII